MGGSCTEPTVKSEARKALRDGQSRLIRLCPPEQRGQLPQEGVVEVELTCISGGTLEIYLEPNQPQPQLIVIGHLPLTEALAVLGKDMGYAVTVLGMGANSERFPQADAVFDNLDFSQIKATRQTYFVVASHGNYDEEALEKALKTDAPYVALVANPKRRSAIMQYLRDSDLTEEQLARLKIPAGLDFGAVTPEEIALSILAEIVQMRRHSPAMSELISVQEFVEPAQAKDPVCDMMVDIATAIHKSHYFNHDYYFCAAGCKRSFDSEPEKYLIKD